MAICNLSLSIPHVLKKAFGLPKDPTETELMACISINDAAREDSPAEDVAAINFLARGIELQALQ